ncbi:uncharacterized protein VP01_1905g1 [Puccinia sorghi]|uniref:Uncharacterized protein n=1 Tax=Puccinia sorghi TaxID=27349 RepID=A0A0L6VCW5_9BASI|nr:uncharacterized protein VP01_1905g1 [Puccinia sorghi]
MASGPRRFDNQPHPGTTQMLRTRSDDSQPHQPTAQPLSHNRAAAKDSKNPNTTHAHKIAILQKPLPTAQKAVAHKRHKHHKHHPSLATAPALSTSPTAGAPPPAPSPDIQPVQPSTPQQPLPAAAAAPLVTKDKEDLPASHDPETSQVDPIPAAAQDSRPNATTPTDTGAPVSQSTEPEAPMKEDSISQPASSPQDPPASHDPATPQADTIPAAAQDSRPDATTSTDTGAPVSQLTEPEALLKQDSISQPASSSQDPSASQGPATPQAETIPAVAQDPRPDATISADTDAPVPQSTGPEDTPEQDSISQPASAPLLQDSPLLMDDLPPIETAPIPAVIASSTLQGVEASYDLPLAPIVPFLNEGALLNNGTTLNNSSANSFKANLNGLNTGNLLPHTPASDPSNKHTGAAVGGFFGLLALIALAAVIFMMISRRRRGQQADESFQGLGESARTGSTDQEKSKMTEAKSGTQEGLAIHTNYHGSHKASDEPMMSPMDPVTRFSQGGFTLLKRLESITDSFNRSVHSASPDGSSSDDEPLETSLTNPSAAELGRHVGLPKSESRMHGGEPAMVSPLLLPETVQLPR